MISFPFDPFALSLSEGRFFFSGAALKVRAALRQAQHERTWAEWPIIEFGEAR